MLPINITIHFGKRSDCKSARGWCCRPCQVIILQFDTVTFPWHLTLVTSISQLTCRTSRAKHGGL